MVKNGLKKIKKDHRDYSTHTFGSVAVELLPFEYNNDAGLTMPDQTADGLPEGCTGYAQSELCQDEDVTAYKPKYTYDKTLFMEGAEEGVGCDIRDSLKSTIVYGVQANSETTDEEAATHRRGQFFNVQPTTDFFDGIRNIIYINRLEKRSVSTGTPWFPEFEPVGNGNGKLLSDGIITTPDYTNKNVSWHNWKICGWKTINGVPYLIGKTWQGRGYGDGGYAYFPREVINSIMSIDGTGAFTLGKANAGNIKLVELTIMATILSYLRMWLNKIINPPVVKKN